MSYSVKLLYMIIYYIEDLQLVGFKGHFDQVIDIGDYILLTWDQFYKQLIVNLIPRSEHGPWEISKEEFNQRIFDILL